MAEAECFQDDLGVGGIGTVSIGQTANARLAACVTISTTHPSASCELN